MYPFLRNVTYTKVFGNLFLCLPTYSPNRATKFHSDIPTSDERTANSTQGLSWFHFTTLSEPHII